MLRKLTPPKNEPNRRRQRTNQPEVYFREIGASVFGDYMLGLGAHITETGSPTSLRFESDSWYTQLLVFPEEAPRFCPRIAIGVLPEIGYMDRDRQVDILHTLPQDSALRRYNLEWRYSNAVEMQQVFERVRKYKIGSVLTIDTNCRATSSPITSTMVNGARGSAAT